MEITPPEPRGVLTILAHHHCRCGNQIRQLSLFLPLLAMRALSVGYDSSPSTSRLLHDVRSMVRPLLRVALDENHRSAIALRKETAAWFAHSWRSRYAAHWHHSACSMAVGIARSYWRLKRTGRNPGTPRADRLVAGQISVSAAFVTTTWFSPSGPGSGSDSL